MMKSPATCCKPGGGTDATFYLGKSEKGVYSALLYWVDCGRCPQFRVWFLKEEEEEENDHIHMEWVLKTNISLPPLLANKLPLLHSHSGFADDEWRVIRNHLLLLLLQHMATTSLLLLMMMNGTLTMLIRLSLKKPTKIIRPPKQTLLISSLQGDLSSFP